MARLKRAIPFNNDLVSLKIINVQLQLRPNLSLKEVVACSTIQRQLQRDTKKNNRCLLNRKSKQSWNQPSSTTSHYNRTLQTLKIWTASPIKKPLWLKHYKNSQLSSWEPMNPTTPTTAASLSLSDLSSNVIKQRKLNAVYRSNTL